MTDRRFRICVATSYGATEEPRGPRYAAELARIDPRFEITFIDCVPRGRKTRMSSEFRDLPNVTCRSWYFPWRGGGKPRLLAEKIRQRVAQMSFRRHGTLRTELLSTRSIGLEKMLIAERADLYFGFNIDTLLPVCNAARIAGVPCMFDCMEIHAEMAHHQSATERAVIQAVQRRCLPLCSLVLAASPQAAAYIEREFGIRGVLPLLNAAPKGELPQCEPVGDFSLYWRNSTIDLGLRGLDDILRAMPMLPAEIRLYVQGRPATNGGRVEKAIRELGIGDRVTILPPYRMEDAVRTAVPYTIGLSLESPASINMNLTSTNKFFEYAMAGLAIVSTRTEGLRHLIDAAGLGLVYEPGDAADLARQVLRLYADRELLARMRRNAREYALREGNLEFQLQSFRETFRQRVLPLLESARTNAPGGRL
jgi:glycosyl transferase family 1/glycosyl transferase family 4